MEAEAPGQCQLWGGKEVFLLVTSHKGQQSPRVSMAECKATADQFTME